MFASKASLPRMAACVLFFCTSPGKSVIAQSSAPIATAAVSKARGLYYTPVDGGLQGFHCEVNFDWRDFMQKASNQPVPEGDARLAYLRGIKLSVDDDLRAGGKMNWTASTPEPDGSSDSIEKIRGGMQQLWSGFFQTWNSFFTGDIVMLDAKATAEQTASGYHVAARDGAQLAEEQYDSKLVLQTVHVVTPTVETTMMPTFLPGPHGLLVSSVRSVYRQPPTAEPTEVLMQVKYGDVGGFQLPSEVSVSVGPAAFDFRLMNCTVTSRLTLK